MNTGEPLRIEKKDGIVLVTLDSRNGMNVLDTETLELLGNTFLGIENDEEARAVIIRGEKNFCAGADIKKMKDMTPAEATAFSRLGHRVCAQIENMGKAVIAAINGYALGGGCEIALACDVRIASESAKLGQPEINLGIVPGFGGTQRLPRLVGIGMAKELIFTGKIIDAKDAESIGLVNQTVKDGELMKRAEEMATLIAQKSPLGIRAAKKLINESRGLQKGLEHEVMSFAECFAAQDRIEGMNAFLEKRSPKFGGT